MGLIAFRHPSVAAKGLCYGRAEVRLAATAPAEITAAVTALRRERAWPTAVLTSPATRCRGLAQALAHAIDAPLNRDPRLQELDFGAWEGRPWSKIPREELDHWAEDPVNRAPPGGETFEALQARVTAAAHARPGALFVTHAGPIRALSIAAGTADFDGAFAAPVAFATPIAIAWPPPTAPLAGTGGL